MVLGHLFLVVRLGIYQGWFWGRSRERARGKISVIMSKQEMLLFFIREIKTYVEKIFFSTEKIFLWKKIFHFSNEKVRLWSKASKSSVKHSANEIQSSAPPEGPVWVQWGTHSALGTTILVPWGTDRDWGHDQVSEQVSRGNRQEWGRIQASRSWVEQKHSGGTRGIKVKEVRTAKCIGEDIRIWSFHKFLLFHGSVR